MDQPFNLPAELSIYSALETRDALTAWAGKCTAAGMLSLRVSGSAVESVDAAGLQLLLALGNLHMPWQLLDASDVLVDALEMLGLAHWGRPEALTSTTAKSGSPT
jgi:anti-anti-sigma regulatory factor